MDLFFDTVPGTALFLLGFVVAAFVHEGGHAIAGRLVGIMPRVVNVGVGRPFLKIRIGRTWLVVRICLLAAGWCACEPSARRWALAALVAGGPLANLLALLALYGASRLVPSAYDGLEPFGFAEAAGAALTLYPMRQMLNGRQVPTDGLRLFRLVARGQTADLGATYAKLLRPVQHDEAPAHPFTLQATEILYQSLRQDRWSEAWACRDAVAGYRALLDKPDLTAQERAFVLCDLVSQHVMLGYPHVAPGDLDRWSGEALALGTAPRSEIARGAVLVETGHPLEGKDLLITTLDALKNRGELLGLSSAVAYVAIGRAVATRPHADVAEGWFRLARKLAPRLPPGVGQAIDRWERKALSHRVVTEARWTRLKRWLAGADLP